MKTSKYFYVFLLMVFVLPFAACNDTDDGSYVAPITLYEKVKGSWTLNNVIQVDETAKVSGIKPDEMSLYSRFGFESLNITLNVDAENQPTSYKVGGTAPELFPNEGYWDLDTSFPYASGTAPTINLYSDAAKTSLTGRLTITSVPGAKSEMELKLTRKSKDVAFVSYVYQLSSLNE